MKSFLLLLLLSAGLIRISAQTVSLQSYDLQPLSLKRPVLAGKAGNRIFVLDMPEKGETPVFIFDSATLQLSKKVFLPQGAYTGKILAMDNAIRFSWYPVSDLGFDSALVMMSQVSTDGNIRDLPAISISEKPGVIPTLVGNTSKSLQLVYGFENAGPKNILFRGVLIDPEGNKLRELSQLIAFERISSQSPYVIVDSRGNIHIVVLDRLGSDRVSANVAVNTIPFGESKATAELFSFDQVKMSSMFIVDDPAGNTVRLQGFYYDTHQQNLKRGLASLAIPYQRNMPAEAPKLIPFPDKLRAQLRKGMPHLKSKDDPLNSLQLKDILVQDGQTIFNYWLPDIPETDMVSESIPNTQHDADAANSMYAHAVQNQQVSLNRWLDDQSTLNKTAEFGRSPAAPYLYGANGNISYPVFSEPKLFQPVVGNGISPVEKERIFEQMDRRMEPAMRRSKLISFRFDRSGQPEIYGVIDPVFLNPPDEDRRRLVSYPLIHRDNIYFTSNNAMLNESSQFALVQLKNAGDPVLHASAFPLPAKTSISRPVKTGTGQYVALTKDMTQNSYGLLVYEIR
ncbi:MAG: hypothetical protein JO301_05345 [Chitinophagaceae bacterium]|nr:hypothetical protein [Chitinophagaceae bacterium]